MKKLNFIVLMACAAFLLGSCNGSSSDNNTSEGNWITSAELPGYGRFYAVSFTIGDSVAYVGTGNDGDNYDAPLKDFWKFNGNGWTSIASIPVGRQQAVAFSIGGKGYVGTGTGTYAENSGIYFKDFYAYDAATDTWSAAGQIPDFPGDARARATAFSVNNKGYVLTGQSSNGSILYLDMYSFNPATGSWSQEEGLPNDKRYGASAFTFDGKGYVLGGLNSSGSLSPYFFAFNPATSTWERKRQIWNATDSSYDDDWSNIRRLDAVTLVMGSNVYYMLGSTSNGGSPNGTTWAYDPYNDTWDQRSSYTSDNRSARWGAVGFSILGRGFVGTGWSGGAPAYGGFDEYFPNQDLNSNN
ncbi:MAG: kelch repeat-containing protein [Arachidicoccus sp.]|nr:kelch repeat-containing protein [Arachidicoccus sp.]